VTFYDQKIEIGSKNVRLASPSKINIPRSQFSILNVHNFVKIIGMTIIGMFCTVLPLDRKYAVWVSNNRIPP
jgi:hypothetical protein